MTTSPVKYDAGGEIRGDGWLTLHRNENLFIDADYIQDLASQVVVDLRIAAYPEPTCSRVREALSDLYGVKPSNIFVGNGSDEVLSDLLGLLRSSYDRLGVLDAHFKIYDLLAHRFGFHLDVLPGETFASGRVAPAPSWGLAVVDSPNAITSRAVQGEDLGALCEREDSFLIWDNAYGEFSGDEVPPVAPNRVLVRTFSKFFGLASLRIGYCIADEGLVEELLMRKDAFNVNGFAQAMALKVLREKAKFDAVRDLLLECREALVERLCGVGFVVEPPAGNYVLVRHPGASGESIQAQLWKRRIAVRRFKDPLTSDWIRITVPPLAGIHRLLEALDEITSLHEIPAD